PTRHARPGDTPTARGRCTCPRAGSTASTTPPRPPEATCSCRGDDDPRGRHAPPPPGRGGRAAVTGANGFVGRSLIPELVDRGQCVNTLVRAGTSFGPPAQDD